MVPVLNTPKWPRSRREQLFIAGSFATFAALAGLAVVNLSVPSFLSSRGLRVALLALLVLGTVLYKGALVVRVVDRNTTLNALKENPQGRFWLYVVIILLWICFIPLLWYFRVFKVLKP